MPLADASVKDEVQIKINDAEKYNLAKYKLFLPLTVKINNLDDNEELIVKLEKNGKILFTEQGKVEIIIQGSEQDLINVFQDENFKENIKNINVYGVTFKGKVAVILAERILKVKFNQDKNLGDKILGAVIYPVTLFLKN